MTEGRKGGRSTGRRIAVLATLALAWTGCRATVPIGRLLDDPYEYDGAKVKVEGDVTGSVGAWGHGAYVVDDGTGSLVIVTDERGVPREGARVAVTGWFQPLFTVGRVSTAVILERGRDIRYGRIPAALP